MVGSGDDVQYFCSSSWVSSRVCTRIYSCGLVASIYVCYLESLAGCYPRSMFMMGHLPPLLLSGRLFGSLNMMLCLNILSLELYLHPPRRCMLANGLMHLLHNIGPCALCLLLHLDRRVSPMLPHKIPFYFYMKLGSMHE